LVEYDIEKQIVKVESCFHDEYMSQPIVIPTTASTRTNRRRKKDLIRWSSTPEPEPGPGSGPGARGGKANSNKSTAIDLVTDSEGEDEDVYEIIDEPEVVEVIDEPDVLQQKVVKSLSNKTDQQKAEATVKKCFDLTVLSGDEEDPFLVPSDVDEDERNEQERLVTAMITSTTTTTATKPRRAPKVVLWVDTQLLDARVFEKHALFQFMGEVVYSTSIGTSPDSSSSSSSRMELDGNSGRKEGGGEGHWVLEARTARLMDGLDLYSYRQTILLTRELVLQYQQRGKERENEKEEDEKAEWRKEDDPLLRSIAQELHTSLNTTTSINASTDSNPSATLHAYEFRLESFLTHPRTCTTLFPPRVQKSRYSQILVQERLVLLSAGPSSSKETETKSDKEGEEKKATTQVLVAGLEVLEYTLIPLTPPSPTSGTKCPGAWEERIIYIAKVDTSGFWPLPDLETQALRGKSPAQALVKGYLRSVRATSSHGHGLSSPSFADTTTTSTSAVEDTSNINDTPNSAAAAAGKMSALSIAPITNSTTFTTKQDRPRKTSLYIFARAQPQYLFANSAKNPQKRVLDDRGLVRWWKNTAASVYAESMDPPATITQEQEAEGNRKKTKVKGWWHIPGIETERQAHNVIQSTPSTTTTKSFEWTYGYPDKDSTELANALVPQFPDDPKSRMMQSPSCQGGFVNIRTFWELAAIGEESGAGKITGFFRVVEEAEDEDEGEGEGEGEEVKEAVQEKAVTGTTAGYTKVINFLLDLEFSTLEDARKSTRSWQDRVEIWIRKSVEREAEHALEVEAARRQGQEKEDKEEGKEEGKEKEEKEKGEVVSAARPLWIQKGTVEIMLRHGSGIPPPPTPAVTKDPTTTVTVPTPVATPAVVNTLSAGLIKRKAPIPASTPAATTVTATAAATPAVNVLGAGLIKRKVVAPTSVIPSNDIPAPAVATTVPVVNVLGAGLIKRKAASTSTSSIPITTPETSSAAPVVNILGASSIKKRKTDS
ncbi:hypothetical protein BGZ47_002659, partial [Haplosporangium gracile]